MQVASSYGILKECGATYCTNKQYYLVENEYASASPAHKKVLTPICYCLQKQFLFLSLVFAWDYLVVGSIQGFWKSFSFAETYIDVLNFSQTCSTLLFLLLPSHKTTFSKCAITKFLRSVSSCNFLVLVLMSPYAAHPGTIVVEYRVCWFLDQLEYYRIIFSSQYKIMQSTANQYYQEYMRTLWHRGDHSIQNLLTVYQMLSPHPFCKISGIFWMRFELLKVLSLNMEQVTLTYLFQPKTVAHSGIILELCVIFFQNAVPWSAVDSCVPPACFTNMYYTFQSTPTQSWTQNAKTPFLL